MPNHRRYPAPGSGPMCPPIRAVHAFHAATTLALITALAGPATAARAAEDTEATEAAATPGAAPLAEQVLFVPVHGGGVDAELETTVYRPDTPPPWPLVVINHGSRGLPDPHQQPRYQPVEVARYFLDRGYLVVAPMREGFSKSTGRWEPSQCQTERYALRYGPDIAGVIDWFVAQGQVLPDQVLVTGQSNGGMVGLAWSTQAPKARAFINFAGGVNTTYRNCDWAAAMIEAARSLGAKARIRSLWIYTEDDNIFPPSVSKPFFEAWHGAGAPATYRLFPHGGHPFSQTRSGRQAWGPEVEAFLKDVGLPSRPRGAAQAPAAAAAATAAPAASTPVK